MSRRNVRFALEDMREYASAAREFSDGLTRASLGQDRMRLFAILHAIEVLGEAAGRVPGEVRARHAHVPWTAIVGMRNRLIHGYDAVDLDLLWLVVDERIPKLIADLDSVLQQESR